jgi:simple sugar transport system ATP-binding protein/ribose transport system ATP-binding protein
MQVRFRSPRDALTHGVTTIAQELKLVLDLTVVENVYLGSQPHKWGVVARRHMLERYRKLSQTVGFELPPDAVVRRLRTAEQQKVEILRAVARDARLIVMDEPTAALSGDEAAQLAETARALRDKGTTIVFVSHFLEEVLHLAETITVLRDGRVVQTTPAAEQTQPRLVSAMLGRKPQAVFPAKVPPRPGAPAGLTVEGLATPGLLRDVSLEVREGEIVGLAGLVGSGRSEVARAIFGADRRSAGSIRIAGQDVDVRSPAAAVRAGIAMLPESRAEQGLLLERRVAENITLPHLVEVARCGVIHARREQESVEQLLPRVDVHGVGGSVLVHGLSGGNQQKVLLGKWLYRVPRVLMVDEPTRGVDIGAKRAIYDLLQSLAAGGLAILVISSDIEEVLGLSHRVLVMRRGRIVAAYEGDEISDEAVMTAAFGTHQRAAEGVGA